MPTTVGRSRGRQGVHSGAQGAAGDHMRKIMATLITAIVVLVAVLVLTKAGRDIDAATQRFMLYYAGVLALVGLTGSVLLGLVATDRIVMTPGHRVMAQAVHRAFSFGTLAFLIIHIVTEILAQRSHVIDAVVPFLSPYRTFYIGLGTIASDLIVLLVVTSILRKRFTEHGKAWRWRAIHYASYVAFVFGVLHGLLGGRTAKPYVDWSYGFAIAVTALGLAVRFLAISLRPKESLPSSPSADRARPAGSSPLHAAALGLAQARLGSTIGGTVQVLPAGLGGQGAADSWAALPVPGRSPASGPLPALGPAPAYAGPPADAYQRPRLHAAGRAAVRRRWVGRDAGSSLRVRGPVALGAGRPRPAAALRARVRRTAAVRGRAAGTRRHTPGRTVLLPVRAERTAGPSPRRTPRTTRTVPDQAAGPPGPACRSRRIPGPRCPPRPAPATGIPARCLSSEPARCLSPARGRCPVRIPARCRGPVRGSRRATGWVRVPVRCRGPPCPGRLGSHAAPGHRPDAPPRHGPMPRPAPARCPVRIPARCRGPARGSRRATGWVRVRVRCRVRARAPCPAWADRSRCRRPDTGPVPRLGTGPMPPRFDGRPDAGPPARPAAGMPPRRTGPMPRPGTGPMPRPRSHAPPRSAVAGWRPGHRSPQRPPPRAARRGSHRARPTDPRYRDMPGPTGGDEWQ